MSYNISADRLAEMRNAVKESSAKRRILSLFDEHSFVEIDAFAKNGEQFTEVVCGYGTIEGAPAFAFAQNPDVSGGAMGLAQSKKIQRIYDLAFKNGMPVIGIYDSKGAHIDEGLDVLHAFTGLIHSANMLSGVVPQISLIMGMCTGSNAVLASLADISVICEGARMSLNPPSIYEKPEKIGSAKSAYENGSVQMLVKDENECVEAARKLLRLLPQNNLSPLPGADGGTPSVCPVLQCDFLDAEDKTHLSDDFGSSVETLLARINGILCGAVVTASEDRQLDADACVKVTRFVRLCDSFSIPIITVVDADGFTRAKDSEIDNGPRLAAMISSAYCEATTPKITLISGHACGGAYTAFAGRSTVADMVFAFPEAVISPLPPEASVIVMHNERLKSGEAMQTLTEEFIQKEASAFAAAEKGYVDDIISKEELREKLTAALRMLSGKRAARPAKKHTNIPF